MSNATAEPARPQRAVRPSKAAKLARAKRRRGPRLTPHATKSCRRSDIERLVPPVTLAEWVSTVREARRYLGRIEWRRLGAAVSRGTLAPRQARALLRLVGPVMALLLREVQRSNPAKFNQLLNLTGFGEVLVKEGDGGLDIALVGLKDSARSMGETPHKADAPFDFVIYLAAAIETLDKLGVELDDVFPHKLTQPASAAA